MPYSSAGGNVHFSIIRVVSIRGRMECFPLTFRGLFQFLYFFLYFFFFLAILWCRITNWSTWPNCSCRSCPSRRADAKLELRSQLGRRIWNDFTASSSASGATWPACSTESCLIQRYVNLTKLQVLIFPTFKEITTAKTQIRNLTSQEWLPFFLLAGLSPLPLGLCVCLFFFLFPCRFKGHVYTKENESIMRPLRDKGKKKLFCSAGPDRDGNLGGGMLYRKRGLAGNPAGESRSSPRHSITTSRITHTERESAKTNPKMSTLASASFPRSDFSGAAKLVPPPTYYRVILTLYRRTSLAHYKVGNSCQSCCWLQPATV
jgi:hypothetical protein